MFYHSVPGIRHTYLALSHAPAVYFFSTRPRELRRALNEESRVEALSLRQLQLRTVSKLFLHVKLERRRKELGFLFVGLRFGVSDGFAYPFGPWLFLVFFLKPWGLQAPGFDRAVSYQLRVAVDRYIPQ